MRLQVRHGGGELTVPSQKEFLILYQRGFIGPDDLVRRESKSSDLEWVKASDLPWIKGTALDEKQDGRRLIGLTVILMILGLLGVLYIQSRAAQTHRAPSPSHPPQ